jgi:hypothetical protein
MIRHTCAALACLAVIAGAGPAAAELPPDPIDMRAFYCLGADPAGAGAASVRRYLRDRIAFGHVLRHGSAVPLAVALARGKEDRRAVLAGSHETARQVQTLCAGIAGALPY